MNQFGPYSFTADPQISPTGEPLIHFEINQIPTKSTEFGYLLIARDLGYAENVYLINTTRKAPDAYLDKLSRLEGNPSGVDLICCLPILNVQRIRQRCRVLLAEYNQEFGGNFYRIQKQKALDFIRQLAQKE